MKSLKMFQVRKDFWEVKIKWCLFIPLIVKPEHIPEYNNIFTIHSETFNSVKLIFKSEYKRELKWLKNFPNNLLYNK